MAINNNTTLVTSTINAGKTAIAKKPSQASVSEVAPVTKKAQSATFSMILSEKQKDSIHQALGYDQPTPKQRGALDTYQKIAGQEQRDAIINSMSFHFVV
ncbi:hypothetical protein [Psychromonas antarctica]|uniref:hypothetical protein n=1 Tax=Psychromonas antarctica TaxID=67573 RepID=UPI001EE8D3DE|nr:hypothetical protein [Psychromonas antarctica]MCG6202576.1 hypothetical protein [Psychromonas antarctica]